jgi:hypothetical protein
MLAANSVFKRCLEHVRCVGEAGGCFESEVVAPWPRDLDGIATFGRWAIGLIALC